MKQTVLLPILIFLLFGYQSVAQEYAEGCDGIRYAYDVFPQYTKTTVKYATAIPEQKDLFMDIYQPESDPVTKRPVIIFAHGGAFLYGDKSEMHTFCEFYVRRGFVVATIQYRLITGFPTVEAFTQGTIKAVSDMKGAYRWFKSDAAGANEFRADTTKMFIGGLSAGGITALHMAYLDASDPVVPNILNIINANGGFSGNTGDAENRTHTDNDVFGVFNFCGALYSTQLMGAGDPMLMSYHGDNDLVVPIDSAIQFGNSLYGSRTLHQIAIAKGIPSHLEVVPGGGHTDIYTAPEFAPFLQQFVDKSTALYYPALCGQSVRINRAVPEDIITNVYPNPAIHSFQLDILSEVDAVHIFNMEGRMVAKINNKGKKIEIDCSLWTAGTYRVVPIKGRSIYNSVNVLVVR